MTITPNPKVDSYKKKPKFIVFEGIDGCGKSTLIKEVGLKQRELFLRKVQILHEPGFTPLGGQLRNILLNTPKSISLSSEITQLLMEASRLSILDYMISEWEKDPNILFLGDRHRDSTLAYQTAQGGDIYDLLNIQTILYKNKPKPDLIFYLDTPIDIAQSRLREKQISEGFDEQGEEFFKKVKEVYESIINANREHYYVVDASQPFFQVLNTTINIINFLYA